MDNNKLKIEQQMKLNLKDIGLSGKVVNYYYNKFGCKTIGDLFQLDKENLLSIGSVKGYGYSYLYELLSRMKGLNLKFNWEDDYYADLKERMENGEAIELSKLVFSDKFCRFCRRYRVTNSFQLIKNYGKFIDKLQSNQYFNEMDNEIFFHIFGIEIKKKSVKKEPEQILIEELGFSIRTFNSLKRANINTLRDIINCSFDDLLKIRNFTMKCYYEVINKVHLFGYKFNGEPVEQMENNEQKISISNENNTNNSETDLSKLEISQIKENEEISKRIAKKEELLEKYQKLIEEKNMLLEKERELDNKIAEALQTLNKINGDNNGKSR